MTSLLLGRGGSRGAKAVNINCVNKLAVPILPRRNQIAGHSIQERKKHISINTLRAPHLGPHPTILYVGVLFLENKGEGHPHKEFLALLGAPSFFMWGISLFVFFRVLSIRKARQDIGLCRRLHVMLGAPELQKCSGMSSQEQCDNMGICNGCL